MSLAHHDIERQVALAVALTEPDAETEAMQDSVIAPNVVIIAQTDRIRSSLAEEMSQDDTVDGQVIPGTLADTIAAETVDWTKLNVIVFEVSDDIQGDIDLITELMARPDVFLQCVVVTDKAMSPELTKALYQAGIHEILKLASEEVIAKAAPEIAEVEVAEELVLTGGDVTVLLRARGGVGATTLAVNLAISQTKSAAAPSVALVDLDIQNGAIALAMDLPDSADATALLQGDVWVDDAFLDRAMVTHQSGVDVLTAPDVFAPLSAMTPEMVINLIQSLKARYDHVVLDMPQSVVEWVEPVLNCASRVLVVTDLTLASLKRARRLIDLIGEEHMTLPVKVVINGVKRPLMRNAAHKEAARLIGRPLDHWVPSNPRVTRRADDMGVPLQIGAKRSDVAKAISALCKSVFATKVQG